MTGVLRKIPIISAFVPSEQPKVAPARANLIQGRAAAVEQPATAAIAAERKAVQEAAAEKRKKIRRSAGREATVRTGPLGAPAPAASVARKTLLGQ